MNEGEDDAVRAIHFRAEGYVRGLAIAGSICFTGRLRGDLVPTRSRAAVTPSRCEVANNRNDLQLSIVRPISKAEGLSFPRDETLSRPAPREFLLVYPSGNRFISRPPTPFFPK